MTASETITREVFAALVQKVLTPYSKERWMFDAASFSLYAGFDDQQICLPLSIPYQSFITSDGRSNLLNLQRQLRTFLASPPIFAKSEILSGLLPLMRSHVSFQRDKLGSETGKLDDNGELIFFPYAEVLAVGLVLDNGETIQRIYDVQLDQFGLCNEEAVDIAVSNLQQNSMEPFRLLQAGFYISPWKDGYDNARLLLLDLFSNLKIDGEVVALTPTPDILLVTGSRDIVGMELMLSIGTTLIKTPDALLALPLVLREGRWTSFSVPDDDPMFDTVEIYRTNVIHLIDLELEKDSLTPKSKSKRREAPAPPRRKVKPTGSGKAMRELEEIVSMPIPKGARLTFCADAKNKESTLEFVLFSTIEELKLFYQEALKVGSVIEVPTERGPFTIAEAIGAATTREAWFGPSNVEGETILRLVKRVNFNTPAVHNAFAKQQPSLLSFEQFFGVALLETSQPIDELQINPKNVTQNFLSPDLSETILQFFRIQMSGPRTIYFAADSANPHTVIDMDTGLIATIQIDNAKEGTYFSLSKSLE